MLELKFDRTKCADCKGIFCLTRCQYLRLDKETAKREWQKIIHGDGGNPAMMRRIADAGHEIASHGWDHARVFTLGREAFAADIALDDAAGLAIAAGDDPARVFAALGNLQGAPGRLELVGARGGDFVAGDGSMRAFPPGEREAAPAVSGETLEGEPLDLADLDGIVVVNFWASWCRRSRPTSESATRLWACCRAFPLRCSMR